MFSTHFSWPYEEKFVLLQRKYKQKIKVMTTVASPAKRKTMKAIADARSGKDVTWCNTFEDYLKATAE